ncbi:acyltransferase [Desulforhabdus amnigena]|uniref:Acyltransferase n=1 Tax=Desulforhabdus amnigena TaxID=40218 RepID=A0A9W6L9Z5_9BACT|nr:acyltransferase [Desulforhabdus amnigena]GLI35894.1 hypothetical protein DAMNIGENAA_33270 [Desulforhabdus amnigena]
MISEIARDLLLTIVTHMMGPFGNRLRYLYYRKRLAFIHPTTILDVGVQIINPQSISIGENTHIDRYCILIGGSPKNNDNRELKDIENPNFQEPLGKLIIGRCCHIAPQCILSGIGGLVVGDQVTISAASKVYSLSHHYRSFSNPKNRDFCFGSGAPLNLQCLVRGPIVIENNVGIGANSIILPGVTIEEQSFVSIGSVVRHRVLQNQIVAGNPAVFVKNRFKESCTK